MPFRKLAGYRKNGEPWVAPEVKRELGGSFHRNLLRHQVVFKREVNSGKSRDEALRLANRAETRGMTARQRNLYNLELARLAKDLPVRVSYSPLRKKR